MTKTEGKIIYLVGGFNHIEKILVNGNVTIAGSDKKQNST